MAKGRKSIPSKIIDLRGGTAHTHKKPRDQEPRPPEKMPECPEHLDEQARIEWKRCGDVMQSIGLMTELDMAVLAGYCQAFSEWARATTEVPKQGPVWVDPNTGLPKINPWLRVAREAYDRMMRAAVLLGLSPSSRATLKVEKPKAPDAGDEFLKQIKK